MAEENSNKPVDTPDSVDEKMRKARRVVEGLQALLRGDTGFAENYLDGEGVPGVGDADE